MPIEALPDRVLTGETQKFYTDALAAYQRNSNDVIDLLSPEHGRFSNCNPEVRSTKATSRRGLELLV
jgi:hypothetical protein